MHIVSGVQGLVAPERDAFDLFAAAFPAGTLVGAPKVRAMQLIAELEPTARGLYGGTVGYFAQERQHGPGDHDPHDGVRRRRIQLPGRRGHRRRQRAGQRSIRRCSPRARSCAARSSSRGGPVSVAAAADRQLRLASPTTSCRRSSCSRPRCSSTATTRSRSTRRRSCADAPRDLAGPGHARRRRRLARR